MLALPKIPRVQPSLASAKGLVACWPFFEGGGSTLHDVSGYGLDAAISGGASWVEDPSGNQGLNFNGDNYQARTGIPQFAPSTNTITMLVRAVCEVSLAPPETAYQFASLLTNRNAAQEPFCGLILSSNGGGSGTTLGTGSPLIVDWNDTSAEWNASSGLFPTPGVPFLAAGIVTPNSSTTWLIDQAGGARSFVLTISNSPRAVTDPWTIGNDPVIQPSPGTRFWPGTIFEARLYNRALAPSEIWDIYMGNG